jgi:hypothetical protein
VLLGQLGFLSKSPLRTEHLKTKKEYGDNTIVKTLEEDQIVPEENLLLFLVLRGGEAHHTPTLPHLMFISGHHLFVKTEEVFRRALTQLPCG